MSFVSVGVGTAGLVTSIVQASKASKNKKAAANALANKKYEPLTNVADSMRVSTQSADLQKEEVARNTATQLDALQGAGTRALGVGVGRLSAYGTETNAKIGADLDMQQKQIEDVRAQDEVAIRAMKEGRSRDETLALSSQYNAANDEQAQASGNALTSLSIAGGAYANKGKSAKGNNGYVKPKQEIPSGIGWKPKYQ